MFECAVWDVLRGIDEALSSYDTQSLNVMTNSEFIIFELVKMRLASHGISIKSFIPERQMDIKEKYQLFKRFGSRDINEYLRILDMVLDREYPDETDMETCFIWLLIKEELQYYGVETEMEEDEDDDYDDSDLVKATLD